jgi:hypothetical protein
MTPSTAPMALTVYLVIVIKGIGVSATRCSTVVFAEEDRSIEGNVSASAIFSISEDIAVVESQDGVSFYVYVATTACTRVDSASDVTVAK